MLSIPSTIISVQNFIELSEAVKNNGCRYYVSKGIAPLYLMLHNDKEHFRYLGESAFRHDWYINAFPLTLTDQIDYHSALIDPRTRLPEERKPHFLSDVSLSTYKFAVAMKNNFCYRRKLNTVSYIPYT
ncbi:hypothetical protein AVEN_148772-1 [Araneus ventricosus]|uniref:Uncharacterized protein n=1 Tax=Araneus ventricosus TaxID=182803 RepID=A0A4Y2QZ82_ARAVE|nr:hypothetical protein AVEN_148772-1 [Araneus ventricosus]